MKSNDYRAGFDSALRRENFTRPHYFTWDYLKGWIDGKSYVRNIIYYYCENMTSDERLYQSKSLNLTSQIDSVMYNKSYTEIKLWGESARQRMASASH